MKTKLLSIEHADLTALIWAGLTDTGVAASDGGKKVENMGKIEISIL